MRIIRSKKGIALVALAAAVALALAAGALAVFPSDNVASYAGCLNTNGSAAGTFSQLAVGDSPARSCGSNQTVVHLSGGDITAVNAGTGLTGGSTNGAATLSLATGQTLPQTCSGSQVPKWNGTGWSCGTDNDTTYSNGTGLDLSGNIFNVSPSYRLPQSCSNNQVAKSNGSNSWSCQDDAVGGTEAFYNAEDEPQEVPRPTGGIGNGSGNYGENVTIDRKFLPPGTYFLLAKTFLSDYDNDAGWACDLEDNTGAILDRAELATESPGTFDIHQTLKPYRAPLTLSAVFTQPAPGANVEFRCKAATDGGATASQTKLTSIKIATLH